MDIVAIFEKIAHLKMQKLGFKSCMVITPYAFQHFYDIPGKGKLPPIVVLHGFGGSAA